MGAYRLCIYSVYISFDRNCEGTVYHHSPENSPKDLDRLCFYEFVFNRNPQ